MAARKPAEAASVIDINLDDIDWDEMEQIEALAGHNISAEFEANNLSMRTIRAFVLWKLRQSDPKMTFDTMPTMRSLSVNIRRMTPVAKGKPDPLASPVTRTRSQS